MAHHIPYTISIYHIHIPYIYRYSKRYMLYPILPHCLRRQRAQSTCLQIARATIHFVMMLYVIMVMRLAGCWLGLCLRPS